MDPDIPGHPSSHYLVSESLRVEMLSALVFLKITKINWWFILENRVGLTSLKAIYLVWGKTKFSGQLTACWHLPRKGGAPGLVPVPLASLIYRGEMPSATAPRTGQISLEAQILAHSPRWETSLFLDGEGADGGCGPHGVA